MALRVISGSCLEWPRLADFVAEVGELKSLAFPVSFLSCLLHPLDVAAGSEVSALTPRNAYAVQNAAAGGGRTISLASRRRFCAMAASVNSSCAPRGPRNRRRPSFRMRLRWANSISTRFRSRHDCSKASVLASARATSRASSWMLRGILRSGAFGQHLDLSGQGPQS